jgi:hypothetical protein
MTIRTGDSLDELLKQLPETLPSNLTVPPRHGTFSTCSGENRFGLPTDGCSSIIGGTLENVVDWYLKPKYRNHTIVPLEDGKPVPMMKYPDNTIFVYYTTEQKTFDFSLRGSKTSSRTVTIKRVTRIQYPNQTTDTPIVIPISGPRNPGPVMAPPVRSPPSTTRGAVVVPGTVAPRRSRIKWAFWIILTVALLLLLVIAFFVIRSFM